MDMMKHWYWHKDDDRVLWLEFNRQDKSANTINAEVLEEFSRVLDLLKDDNEIVQLIICSKKDGGFIAGADILDVFAKNDAPATKALIERGQKVYDQLERFHAPTVALIHGYCLGGGFELALACDWRIVIDSPSVRIGLPEVQLGLRPGWGGSVRLMRMIGVQKTFDCILSGRAYKSKAALKSGLVDAVVPQRIIPETLTHYRKKRKTQKNSMDWLWRWGWIRMLMGSVIKRQIAKKVRQDHYPAPFAMIQDWISYGHHDDKAYQVEVDSIFALAQGETAKNLVRVFQLKDRNKKELSTYKSMHPMMHVHIVGAGVMGGDIAAWCALKGLKVTLEDLSEKQIGQALERATKLFAKHYTHHFEQQRCLDRLMPDPLGYGLQSADLIIEAVSENLSLKVQILKKIEQKARADALIATNTSTICLEKIDEIFQNPERFLGVHFFNPVAQMPLVEIVYGRMTAQISRDRAKAFVSFIDKIGIEVKSSPGFFVNRVLLPYMLQALKLHNKGHSFALIDAAAESFGMPMGPIELADVVGLDVCLAALSSMNLCDDQVLATLQSYIQNGLLGKKTGEGLYRYQNKKPIKGGMRGDKEACAAILKQALTNEALAAQKEQIVQNSDDADLAALFGFGFPPFSAGITHFT